MPLLTDATDRLAPACRRRRVFADRRGDVVAFIRQQPSIEGYRKTLPAYFGIEEDRYDARPVAVQVRVLMLSDGDSLHQRLPPGNGDDIANWRAAIKQIVGVLREPPRV